MIVTQPFRETLVCCFSLPGRKQKEDNTCGWMERAIVSFSKERGNYFAAVDDDTESLTLRLRELATVSGRGITQSRKNYF